MKKSGGKFIHRVKASQRKPGGTWHPGRMLVTQRANPTSSCGVLSTSTAPNATLCCKKAA